MMGKSFMCVFVHERERETERGLPFCSTLLHSLILSGASYDGWKGLVN